jgi:hypothetical protein
VFVLLLIFLLVWHAEDEEASFNAVQCLDTIDSVLEAVQEVPHVLAQLEPITHPVILKYVLFFVISVEAI